MRFRIQTLDWLNAYIDELEGTLLGYTDPCTGCGSLTWSAMNERTRICDRCNPEAIMAGFRAAEASGSAGSIRSANVEMEGTNG
jgi:hypothetical protein